MLNQSQEKEMFSLEYAEKVYRLCKKMINL